MISRSRYNGDFKGLAEHIFGLMSKKEMEYYFKYIHLDKEEIRRAGNANYFKMLSFHEKAVSNYFNTLKEGDILQYTSEIEIGSSEGNLALIIYIDNHTATVYNGKTGSVKDLESEDMWWKYLKKI